MIDMLLHVWVVCVLQNDCKIHNAKVWPCHHPEIPPVFQIWKSWVSAYGLMWFHLWIWVEDMENDRKCDQLCTETTQTQNRKNKKIHSGPLQLVRKMIDMLLHVWVVCVLQNDCKLHNAKVCHCHHPEISPEFQIWKSWVSAYELMWFHLWIWVEDMEMTETVTKRKISVGRLSNFWLTHHKKK